MNQDFTVQKKSNFRLRKKFVQRGSPEKKIPAQAVSEKKKFVEAENSPTPPPHHFSNGPSLKEVSIPSLWWLTVFKDDIFRFFLSSVLN